MIPLRDDIPSVRRPYVTYVLIGLNIIVFIYELSLGRSVGGFIREFGVVPFKITHSPTVVTYGTLLSSMFIHGGFDHIIGNMLYLWIFGDNVEDRLGHFGFLGFYLLSGLVGSGVHILTAMNSTVPTIGASGAISGVLGAYFILYPRAKVMALIPLGIFLRIMSLPAALFLGFWILLQIFLGFASLPGAGPGGGGTAWFAHIGGFVPGVIFGFIAKRRRKVVFNE